MSTQDTKTYALHFTTRQAVVTILAIAGFGILLLMMGVATIIDAYQAQSVAEAVGDTIGGAIATMLGGALLGWLGYILHDHLKG